MAIKIKYHSPLPGTLTLGLVFSLLDAFLHFKNFIKALLQCGKCQREMHWRQIGISLIVKLLLLTDVLLRLLKAERSAVSPLLVLCHLLKKLEIYFTNGYGNRKLLKLQKKKKESRLSSLECWTAKVPDMHLGIHRRIYLVFPLRWLEPDAH